MEAIALLLKSYAGDLEHARRLVRSFHEHNADELTLHCVVPRDELAAFRSLANANVHVLAEEEILASHLVSQPFGGMQLGYINQQIVKLAFWETGLADNYFCVDSEAVFLRDFGVGDFMADEATPFTVMVEDRDLMADPDYYKAHWIGRESSLRRIATELGLDDRIIRTAHGHQVLSSVALGCLVADFMEPRNWSYADLLRFSPYEFSWYTLWVQGSNCISLVPREPFVKVFHSRNQYLAAQLLGVKEADLARAYLAVLVNSNYSRDLTLPSLSTDKSAAIAEAMSYGEAAGLLRSKLGSSFARLLGGKRQDPAQS